MAEWFETWFDEDYALLYAHRDAGEARRAVRLALRLAPELQEGPVLDLGCGTGRHLASLREINPLAFGMDLSRALLAKAPADLRPWLLRGDMRTLPIKAGTLAGACLWFTPFGYFSDEQNRALLVNLGRLLRTGGLLLLDYLNAHSALRSLVPEDRVERAGVSILSRRTLEGDRLVKRMTLTRLATGAQREALESVRLYQPADLVELASQAGFQLRATAGGYDGDPFTEASPRWIGVLQKA
jgi:SAM-dependent methyltransferase